MKMNGYLLKNYFVFIAMLILFPAGIADLSFGADMKLPTSKVTTPTVTLQAGGNPVQAPVRGNRLDLVRSSNVVKKVNNKVVAVPPSEVNVKPLQPTAACPLPRCRNMQFLAGKGASGAYQVQLKDIRKMVIQTVSVNVVAPKAALPATRNVPTSVGKTGVDLSPMRKDVSQPQERRGMVLENVNPTLEILSPSEGANLFRENKEIIRWRVKAKNSSTGKIMISPPPPSNVFLLDAAGRRIMTIAENVLAPEGGSSRQGMLQASSFLWTIPRPISPGSYTIIVETIEGGMSDSQPINIRVPPDRDGDLLSDYLEEELARTFAPEVRLAPDSIDWTRPANVDWYLARVSMRFDHTAYNDCEILYLRSVRQSVLYNQSHKESRSPFGHFGDTLYSSSSNRFFLQPPSDDVHSGAPADQWRTYVHVWPSWTLMGGYDIQYWFFYAYNDFVGTFNHEGDWEHITVTVNPERQVHSVYYSQHEGGVRYTPNQLTFVNGTHPVVYAADGSHANYPRADSYPIPAEFLGHDVNIEGTVRDRTYDGGPIWQTWRSYVNVGERNHPFSGQTFIMYGGRWGEIGITQWTSGPTGPGAKMGNKMFPIDRNVPWKGITALMQERLRPFLLTGNQ